MEAVIHHLVSSPYHELTREEATETVHSQCTIEQWDSGDAEEWQRQQNKGKKRKHKGDADEVAVRPRSPECLITHERVQTDLSSRPRSSASSAGTRMVQLSEMQLMACLDSLKRAKVSAESAAHLCSKAARAFNEEVLCIQQCVDVVESYVPAMPRGGIDPRM